MPRPGHSRGGKIIGSGAGHSSTSHRGAPHTCNSFRDACIKRKMCTHRDFPLQFTPSEKTAPVAWSSSNLQKQTGNFRAYMRSKRVRPARPPLLQPACCVLLSVRASKPAWKGRRLHNKICLMGAATQLSSTDGQRLLSLAPTSAPRQNPQPQTAVHLRRQTRIWAQRAPTAARCARRLTPQNSPPARKLRAAALFSKPRVTSKTHQLSQIPSQVHLGERSLSYLGTDVDVVHVQVEVAVVEAESVLPRVHRVPVLCASQYGRIRERAAHTPVSLCNSGVPFSFSLFPRAFRFFPFFDEAGFGEGPSFGVLRRPTTAPSPLALVPPRGTSRPPRAP